MRTGKAALQLLQPAALHLLPPLQPMAVVGTCEKGIETWDIHVTGTGGHTGMPPIDGTTGGWAGRWVG